MGNLIVPKKERRGDLVFLQLFEDLSVRTQGGVAVLHRGNFEALFGGPCLEFGQLLHQKLFGDCSTPVTQEVFLGACDHLEKIAVPPEGDRHASTQFLFSVFSQGENNMSLKDLETLVIRCMGYSLVTGTVSHEEAWSEVTPDIVQSFVKNMSHHVDRDTQEMSVGRFTVWLQHHCPRLLEGVQQWLLYLLHGHAFTQQGAGQEELWQGRYHLPDLSCPKGGGAARPLPNSVVWALSCVLPLCYLGHKIGEHRPEDYPVGCTWTLLYSSAQHGFSLNRFVHHSSDYRDPTITLLHCHAPTGEDYLFAIAVDTEWKEGEFFWGTEHSCLVQLKPEFQKVVCGSKLINLNEKGRQFPKGLRVMKEPMGGATNQSHIHIAEDFSRVHLFGSQEPVQLKAVEVWGCGSAEAVSLQQRWKAWEGKERERRQKVRKEALEEWADNPDRSILEWAGVTVSHPQEQQQQ